MLCLPQGKPVGERTAVLYSVSAQVKQCIDDIGGMNLLLKAAANAQPNRPAAGAGRSMPAQPQRPPPGRAAHLQNNGRSGMRASNTPLASGGPFKRAPAAARRNTGAAPPTPSALEPPPPALPTSSPEPQQPPARPVTPARPQAVRMQGSPFRGAGAPSPPAKPDKPADMMSPHKAQPPTPGGARRVSHDMASSSPPSTAAAAAAAAAAVPATTAHQKSATLRPPKSGAAALAKSPSFNAGSRMTPYAQSTLMRMLQWARKRRALRDEYRNQSARESRLLHASPEFSVLFLLPSKQTIVLTCRRESTLGEIKRRVIAARDTGDPEGAVAESASLRVLQMYHVPHPRPLHMGEDHAPVPYDDGVKLEAISAISKERLRGLTPHFALRRQAMPDVDVDEPSMRAVEQLVGTRVTWKDSSTGVDAQQGEVHSLRQSMTRLRCEERMREPSPPRLLVEQEARVRVLLPLAGGGADSSSTVVLAVPVGETGDQLLARVFAKGYERVAAESGRTMADFAFKVTGFAEFIDGALPMHAHSCVAAAVRKHDVLELTVVERAQHAELQREKSLPVRPADYVEVSIDTGVVYEARDISMERRAFDRMTCISLFDLHKRPFRVKVLGVENMNHQSVKYWWTPVTRKVLDSAVATPLYITIGVYHGGELMAPLMRTGARPRADSPRWFEWLEAPACVLSNLPCAARICVTLWAAPGGGAADVALGWVNAQLFDFERRLRTGLLSLALWPEGEANPIGTCVPNWTPNVPAVVLELDEYVLPVVHPTSNRYEELPRAEVSGPSTQASAFIEAMARHDSLYQMSDDEKRKLWHYRELCAKHAKVVPKLLLSCQYQSRVDVQQMHELLTRVVPMPPDDALELLDSSFADANVRAYAVRCIEVYTDDELCGLLLQLVQVLKYEPYHNSALARFLVRRALRSPRVGHLFFWYLKSEMHVQEISQRYGLLLEAYLKGCGRHKFELVEQQRLVSTLTDVANCIKLRKDSERLELLRAELRKLQFPKGGVKLPLDPRTAVTGLRIDKCKYMDSKKLPLWLCFVNADPDGKDTLIIFKAGDDLRQDMLTLQMIRLMEKIWADEDMDMRLSPYGALATGDEIGMIEVVLNSMTTAAITKEAGGARAAFRADPLKKWLKKYNSEEKLWREAVENFTYSVAGYCVATYVLGIGDRHNDNVMCSRTGKLFHIDFGHFLGNYKKKLGIKRERAPFVFTPDFAKVLGGKTAADFKRFVEVSCRAYTVLRRHRHLFINLFAMMLSTGIPELTDVTDIEYLTEAFAPQLDEDECKKHFERLIYHALESKATQLNNFVHILAH